MRFKKMKKGLLCLLLVFCMIAGDWIPVLATEPPTEQVTELPTEEETILENPEDVTGENPEETPVVTPTETPEETLGQTPEETPAETPGETPEETPGQTAEETPAETPTETPEETPGQTPEETPAETPVETPEDPGKENSDTENLLKEDEAEKETEEKTEEEIQEELPEEFVNSLVNTTMAQPLAAGDQSRVVNTQSGLEYTKKIADNGDGTYKLTLTVKAPEEVEENIVFVLDLSASMEYNMNKIAKMVLDVQSVLRGVHSKSRLGVVGFYGWAGPIRRNSDSIVYENSMIKELKHGYEFPVYLTFSEWAGTKNPSIPPQDIELGPRPMDEYEDYIRRDPDSMLQNDPECGLEYRKVIPNSNCITQLLIEEAWMDKYDYDNNPHGRFSQFYNTNWQAGFMAARNMIRDDKILGATMVFVTDGQPTVAVNGDLESGTLATVEAEVAAQRAAQWRGWMFDGGLVKRFISVFVDPSGNGSTDPKLIGYPGFGSILSDEQCNVLKAGGAVSSGSDVIVSGSHGADSAAADIKRLVLDQFFADVSIDDSLSEYFEFTSSTPNVKIEKDGEVLANDKAIVNIDTQSKFISMDIKDNDLVKEAIVDREGNTVNELDHYYLTPGATYSLSFDIKPSQKAYDYYADHNQVYPHTGDQDTDLNTSNKISSGKKGFYTNKDTASVSGTKAGRPFNEYYPMPVAQVELLDIPVTKKWVTSETIKPVTIQLYQDGVAYKDPLQFTTSGYTSNGYTKSKTMTFKNVPPGHKYTVKEITDLGVNKYRIEYSPSSYEAPDNPEAGFTVTNTQLIPITIEKIWKIASNGVTPYNTGSKVLKVGIGTGIGQSPSDIIAELRPSPSNSNTWSGTAYIPRKTSGTTSNSYYIKEYFSAPSGVVVDTTFKRVTNGSTYSGTVNPSSTTRYINALSYSTLMNTSKITFTNQEKLSITVGKTWKKGPTTAIPDKLTIRLTGGGHSASTDLLKSDGWVYKTLTIPYEPNTSYQLVEEGATGFDTSVIGMSGINNTGTQKWSSSGATTTVAATYVPMIKHIQFTNTENMSINVEKEWVNYSDNPALPNSLSITLTKPGGSTTTQSMSSPNWATSFTQIDYVTGGTYKIEEKNVPAGYEAYYTVYGTGEQIIKSETKGSICELTADEFSRAVKVKFTNKELIKLSLEKEWIHPTGSSTSPIKVTIMENGNAIETSPYILNASNNWKQDVSIPYKKNANYTISEVCPGGYTSKVTLHNGAGTLIVKEGTNVDNKNSVILNGTDFRNVKKVKFTNTKLLSLIVKKIWGTGATHLSSLPVTLTVGDGEPYQLNLQGSSWQGTIQNIKYDPSATYTITENTQDNTYDISIAAKTGSSGTTVKTQKGALPWIQLDASQFGQTKYVEFTNNKTGSLTVEKKVQGRYFNPTASSEEFIIHISLNNRNSGQNLPAYTGTITYGDDNSKTVTFKDNQADVRLKHGESITIPGIPIGYTCTVRENDYSAYETSYQIDGADNGSGTLILSNNSTVTVINTIPGTVVTGILTDYSSPVMLLSISIIGVISYITLINKKKQKNHKTY